MAISALETVCCPSPDSAHACEPDCAGYPEPKNEGPANKVTLPKRPTKTPERLLVVFFLFLTNNFTSPLPSLVFFVLFCDIFLLWPYVESSMWKVESGGERSG